ncbi:UNVERIFIED_ORG: hypothetical protein M2328_006573 [Rhodococcus erythropolis]
MTVDTLAFQEVPFPGASKKTVATRIRLAVGHRREPLCRRSRLNMNTHRGVDDQR